MQKAVLVIAGIVLGGLLSVPAFAVDVTSNGSADVTACVDVAGSCSTTGGTTGTTTGGGGGGGGGGSSPTGIVFSGRGQPLARVILLKDGQQVLNTISGPDARFAFSLTDLTAGTYTFSILSEDTQGRRSTLFTVPVSITYGATTTISGIFLAPTIAIDKMQVKRGDDITIFGQTAPGSTVTISVHSLVPHFVEAHAEDDGTYLYNFNTAPLEYGTHETQSKAALTQAEVTPLGKKLSFIVGATTIKDEDACSGVRGDFNSDCRVNLVDFSIMAYWYKKQNVPVRIDLNGDGNVGFVDFSILAYYWTG